MEYEREGEIQRFNASKEIASRRDANLIINHMKAMQMAMDGVVEGIDNNTTDENTKNLYRVKGLRKVISAQHSIISLMAISIVKIESLKKWKKKYKTDKEREENPFEEFESDYTELLSFRNFLDGCEKALNMANKTKTKDDDFIIVRHLQDGELWELTENYYEMLRDLQTAYGELEEILYRNGVISAGIEIDEEKNRQELEEEMIKRVVEA